MSNDEKPHDLSTEELAVINRRIADALEPMEIGSLGEQQQRKADSSCVDDGDGGVVTEERPRRPQLRRQAIGNSHCESWWHCSAGEKGNGVSQKSTISSAFLTDSFVEETNGNTSGEPDIEMGLRFTRSSSDVSLESFNKQIQEVEKQVDKLSVLLQNLKEANEESKSVTKASSMKAIRKRMEKDVGEVGKIARGIKVKIEALNKDNIANRQKPGCGKGTAIDRSRTNMTNSLTKKFRDLVTEFQTLRQRIEEEYREVVERRVITVTGSRPDEETINNLIETGNSEQIFQQAMQESGRGQVMNTLEEIQEHFGGDSGEARRCKGD
ncbi:syntaxin-132-like [Salvia splendens]|uniref:syntaxin-132-like n=1 Tax=Salvia splendens TaxID=180675 RepID=UPI001C280743|nr:syntaxin-132-like [Salvia splendens]